MGRFVRWLGRIHIEASPSARAGIVAASANVASTFARGLIPRSVANQAIVTGAVSATMYQVVATSHSAAETAVLLSSGSRGMRGRSADPHRVIVADLAMAGFGAAAEQLLPSRGDEALPVSVARFAAETLMLSGTCGAAVAVTDQAVTKLWPDSQFRNRSIVVDVALGAVIAGLTTFYRHQAARRYGLVAPERKAVKTAGLAATAKAAGTGLAAGAGILVIAGAEQLIASGVQKIFNDRVSRFDIGSPLLGHGVALGVFAAAGTVGFGIVKRRIERGGDIVEPAYPEPPTSDCVTAGPRSQIAFDTIGMEGRRFVLMALTAADITAVTGQPAMDPVRVVAGYESAPSSDERAALCLEEMEAVGAFDRSLICIASPTGVGYVSYVFTETLEYLTGGDCATVVPQYALVPSALALFDTHDGVNLQRRVIELVRDRIASMKPEDRPRLVQFGESLGAQVAMDVAHPDGTEVYDRLGLDAGLYLGVPFRTAVWNSWRANPGGVDPHGRFTLVASSAELGRDRAARPGPRHVLVVHDDDPVNKFSYRMVVQRPWWMGPPTTRPPMVPRETVWRPVTTFALTLVDLVNGMNFKPGTFVRQGHDYRIDTLEAVQWAYGLPCSPEVAASIDQALKAREQDWATRRLIARKFAGARDSVARTLASWGVALPELPDVTGVSGPAVADINPLADRLPHLGTSGVS